MDDNDDATSQDQATQAQPWESTRAGKRIAELKEIEDNIAVLLHFAGCALASLHPDPLSSFTSRELAIEGEDEDGDKAGNPASSSQAQSGVDKSTEFGKYSEAYYASLNDIQIGLRTSIRHLRVTRTSPAPLLDPTFGSLASSANPQPSPVGVGGVALADLLAPLDLQELRWNGASRERGEETDVREKNEELHLSLASRELELDAWRDIANALDCS
ncbi:uncharacterized protein JCM6883_007119 [Sporobolomyces salmoneus]|uniref:uncharacterized protein n=1 Tax=Sporobolomyces salmoneus TaxID=183962 RepID=UPI00317CF081